MEKTLVLVFKNAAGKNVSISLANPKENLDALDVAEAMQELIDAAVFTSSGGDLETIHAARIVSREVTELELI